MAHRSEPASSASRTARASPAGTTPPTSTRTRRSSPTRRRRRCPTHLRAEIEARWRRYPDIRSAAIPALHAAQREHGWCSPTAIEQVACVMRLTPGVPDLGGDLLRHVRDRARRARTTSTCARTSRARCAAPTRSTRRWRTPPATTRASTCARSSASARATSRRWPRSTASTSARSTEDDCRSDRRRRARPAARCCRTSSCAERKVAAEHWQDRWPSSTRSSSRTSTSPGSNTLDVYERRGGYEMLRKALDDGARRGAQRAARLRRARPRRRRLRDGHEDVLHPQGDDGQVPRLQRRRVRARAPSRTAS